MLRPMYKLYFNRAMIPAYSGRAEFLAGSFVDAFTRTGQVRECPDPKTRTACGLDDSRGAVGTAVAIPGGNPGYRHTGGQ
jgi:hypothetical protein